MRHPTLRQHYLVILTTHEKSRALFRACSLKSYDVLHNMRTRSPCLRHPTLLFALILFLELGEREAQFGSHKRNSHFRTNVSFSGLEHMSPSHSFEWRGADEPRCVLEPCVPKLTNWPLRKKKKNKSYPPASQTAEDACTKINAVLWARDRTGICAFLKITALTLSFSLPASPARACSESFAFLRCREA